MRRGPAPPRRRAAEKGHPRHVVPGFSRVTEWLWMMRIYEVGRRADGTPWETLSHWVDAEHAF
jgi:hypothetical protein